MGLALAKALCKQGYHVTISARSKDKAAEAVESIVADVPDARIESLLMDLNSLASVTDFAQQYLASGYPLHLLVNNAGIMNTPFAKTADGFEAQFQVNHLGHFLLTHHLLPVLLATADNHTTTAGIPSRIINISSRAHMRWSGSLTEAVLDEATMEVTAETYDGWRSYGLSKLCNILFTRSLAQRYPHRQRLLVFSLHPGLVDTKLLNVAPGLSRQAIPIDAGIRTALFLATSSDDEILENGGYYYECVLATGPSAISTEAQSLSDAAVLWTKSLAYVGLTDDVYGR